jgi:hypothetical protein
MSSSGGPSIIEDSIEFCFDPSNIKSYTSGSTIFDLSGNRKNGTLNGTYSLATVEGVRGLSFTSVSSPVSNLVQANTVNLRTISIWYNRRDFGFSSAYFLDARTGMSNGYIWGGGFGPGSGGWDSSTVYQNGRNISSGVPLNSLIGAFSGLLSVGGWRNITIVNNANYDCTIRFFSRYTDNEAVDVVLSHIVAYNRALTADEVLKNYNALKGRFLLT